MGHVRGNDANSIRRCQLQRETVLERKKVVRKTRYRRLREMLTR